jgi:hypothetical protein
VPQTRLEQLNEFAENKFGLKVTPPVRDQFLYTYTNLIKQPVAVDYLLSRATSFKKKASTSKHYIQSIETEKIPREYQELREE